MKALFIRILGGYVTIDEALESVSDAEREKILAFAVSDLFNTINKEDVLVVKADGSGLLLGQAISPLQVESLKAQAKAFVSSPLFVVLDTGIKYEANKRMHMAVNQQELDAAKMIHYTWDTLKSLLKF